VAVGDAGQAYFYQRKLISKPRGDSRLQERFPKYDWEVLAKPKVARGERTHDDHSFSVTFSPSGHLCAISGQGGMISVFDMEVIRSLANSEIEPCEDPLIYSFKSSRSGFYGCVRSMAFSPSPWDLLVWAEDHGRAGIADIRTGFCRRQIIKLETHAPDLERIIPEDMTDPYVKGLDARARLIHQYQESFHPEIGASSRESLLGAPEAWADGASLQRQASRRGMAADLDAREQSVLDTLEVTMDEVDDAINHATYPYSVNYRSSPHIRESEDRSPSRAQLESLIDVFRESNPQRVQIGDRQYQPRRRSSVVLSQGSGSRTNGTSRLTPSSSSRSRITASPARMADAGEDDARRPSRTMSTNDLTPTAGGSESQPLPYDIPPSDPWHVIQSALDSTARTTSLPTVSRLTPPASRDGGSDVADSDSHVNHPHSNNLPADSVSAQTSTLPTTLTSSQAQTLARLQANQNFLRRPAPLSELETERQIRRLTSSAAGLDAREGRARPRVDADDEHHLRILEARIQARQRLVARGLDQPSAAPTPISRTSAAQRSELAGRVSAAEMRIARQMMMRSARNMMDRNGNWMAGEALERLLGRSGAAEANGLGGTAVAREIGVGTAGVGWSLDGRQL
jgi:Uncharacterised protein domain (DUF2415)